MEYKDLVSRCSVDFQNMQSNGAADGDGDPPGYEDTAADDDILVPDTPAAERSAPLSEQLSGNGEPSGALSGTSEANKVKKAKRDKPPAKVFYFKPESVLVSDPDK
jgi:hypothetical protein